MCSQVVWILQRIFGHHIEDYHWWKSWDWTEWNLCMKNWTQKAHTSLSAVEVPDCAVDLLERSWTTPDSVRNKLKFGEVGFESKDNVGFEPEYGTCPIEEKDTPLGLLSTIADEWTGLVWIVDMGEEMNSSGPGRYGDNKSRAGVDDLFLLCLEGRLKTDFLFSAIIILKINISFKISSL